MSYLFGDCELEPVRHELRRRATPVAVEPQVFLLLLYLVEHRDRLITKEELNRVIWDGRVVSEWAMSSAIKLARQAIGDNGKRQEFIRTIPRRGFRFVGDVEVYQDSYEDPETELPDAEFAPKIGRADGPWRKYMLAAIIFIIIAGSGVWWWQKSEISRHEEPARTAYGLPDKPSIAVLPFSNLSDDKTQKYFADGIALDISTDLSKISGLFVIAHEASLDPGQNAQTVGKKLGVRHILKGSVRRAGQNIRITAQLIDVTTQEHLWAERYDGSMEDVFALQDKVTARIVSALRLQLTAGEKNRLSSKETTNLAAYDRFLQGWSRLRRRTPQSIVEALAFFTKAIELDPDYGRAYAALASTYWESWEKGWHENLGLTRRAARKKAMHFLAQALARPTALAHQVASEVHRQNQRYGKAIAEAEASIALDPNNADGYVTLAGAFIMVGRAGEAVELVRKAMRLDPHYPTYYSYVLGVASYCEEHFGDAAKYLARAAKNNPENPALLIPLAAAYGQLGRQADAADTMKRYVNLRGRSASPTLSDIVSGWPFQSARDSERLASGLRKAGLSEQ